MRADGGAVTRSKDVADALARSELLPGVGPEAFEPIVGDLTLRALEAGEVLVEQGDPAQDAFVVLSGDLEVVLTEGGNAQRVATLAAGAVVGEIGVLAGDRRSATVRSITASEVAVIPREVFDQLLAHHPEASEELARLALDRLRRTQLVAHFNQQFGVFDPEALAAVEARAEWVQLRAGSTLFEQGEPGDAAYLVATGRLRRHAGRARRSGGGDRRGRSERAGG